MRKTYRIGVVNTDTGKCSIMYELYTSHKKAQEMCNKINNIDSKFQAHVIIKNNA